MNVMIVAGETEIVSLSTILWLLAAIVVLFALYFRRGQRRGAASLTRPVVRDQPVGVEISHQQFDAMTTDLELLVLGDGRDDKGRPFGIYRYRSRSTGRLYDYSCGVETTRIIEYPAPRDGGTALPAPP